MTDESYPQALRYYQEHDWVRVENDEAVFGITWFAQDALGDIVYVDLPLAGEAVVAGTHYGELESVKTVTGVFAPMSGEVVDVNEALRDEPQLVNEDCYGGGWLVRVRLSDSIEFDELMDANAYRAFLEQA
jgi:glycine cleavage system H protein